MRALLITTLIVLASAPARAEDIGVVVTGEATLQPQLVAQVAGWLRQHDQGVAAAALEPDAVNALIDCFVIEDEACARKLVETRAKVTTIVFVRVDAAAGPNGSRDVTLTGYWFAKGQPTITEKRTCEKCMDPPLRAATDDLMGALSRAGFHENGHCKLTSTPTGASIVVDGKNVGVTPWEADLAPGDHQVELHAGERSATRILTVRRGETTALEVPLPVPPPTPSHLVPIVVIGAGVAIAITGGIVYAQFEADDPARRPQPRDLADTHGLGIGIGVVGLAAIGAGVYLWIHAGATSTPVAAAVPGGATIGWAGRF